MTGNNGFEIKVPLGGIGGTGHIHCEMTTGAEDADIGFMVITHPLHIRHDPRVAGKIYCVAFASDHKADLGTHINRPLVAVD